MALDYLDWLNDVFEEAQVSHTEATAPYLDVAMRRIAGLPDAPEEAVFRRLKQRWLNHGVPGRQLLAAMIRDEVYVRKDSPMRPKEGDAYFTNAWRPREAG